MNAYKGQGLANTNAAIPGDLILVPVPKVPIYYIFVYILFAEI